ncbi:MAG: transcriptional regulator [Gracilibacter sp. BRH_c7a]|nr:MAG: transcriptional regulator [Gracilibacter sp. BRH_c7a]
MCDQQFLIFKEVAETRNITLAAKRLHMSQPSISIQIQNLENQYGAKFFERTNKGVTLTHAGKIFYQHICQVIQLMKEAGEKIADLTEDKRGLIHVGATFTIGEYVLPLILGYLNEVRPDIDFKAKIANTETIAQDVLEKRIHVALVEGPIPQNRELVVENFWQDELVVVVPYHHPLATRSSVTIAELTKERMITREQGSGTRKVMEIALEERGFDPEHLNITMELGSTQAIKQVVCAGLGITIISALTVVQECNSKCLKALKIQDCPVYRPLNILMHAQSFQNKDDRYFVNFLHNKEQLAEILKSSMC